MNRQRYCHVTWFVLFTVLAAAGSSQAGWRCRHVARGPIYCVPRPAIVCCPPIHYGCRCYIYPVYDLGDGWYLYHAEIHEQCSEPDHCNDPDIEYHAAQSVNWPQDCAEGHCAQYGAALPYQRIPRLDRVKLKDYNGDDLADGLNPIHYTRKYIQFDTPRGPIYAAVFLMEVAPGDAQQTRTVGFGCEIERDSSKDYIKIGNPLQHNGQPYLFECKLDAVRYVVITHN